MSLPNVMINFKQTGATAIQRGERGIVALVLNGETQEVHELNNIKDAAGIDQLTDKQKEYLQLAFMGYIKPPKKVIIIFRGSEEENYSQAQEILESLKWDYLSIPEIESGDVANVVVWMTSLNKRCKVVLPHATTADTEKVINFTTSNIKTSEGDYSTAEYTSRIAGLLAGTPMTISATFAPLKEVIGFDQLTKEQMDEAISKGQLILYHDGEKAKIARGVNSFTTTTQDKGESFKKIKIVDAMHMIEDDIKKTCEDSYIGKYSNSYDNKCVLITAIQAYLDQLVMDGILDADFKNVVEIDVEQQRNYLKSIGVDVDNMKELDIKKANTRDKVFLKSQIKILDAIEDISLNVTI
ncbi:phage tail sheath C-terminal domain-containing protein [Zhenhengia yiwuensis]|uniref:Phage tail sheath subtilisin-like domain-containing protein n=1 Tax=Zhenhengia yiwuensis TaxID=2763666 RepID=A0A926EKH3_9FIRM|nr:phage tail sheath C-terminal domain-containing protein [Zhenhengia yiwuensis]MBC8580017.1 phage tail sheath subtilisin-like domain-containing protein [Zhenhengia yiwuensis]